MRNRTGGLLLALALLPACAESGPGSHATVVDSAGVQIVTSARPEWSEQTAWRVAADPALRIGEPAASPAEEFTQIGVVRSLADGRIIVTNQSQPPEIRVFDATGRHLHSMGGRGDGPAEFRAIFRVWLAPPDTVIVFDPGQSRITRFGADGTLISITTFEQHAMDGLNGLTGLPWARFADGAYLFRSNRFIPVGAEGNGRSTVSVLRVGEDGTVLDTIGALPEADYATYPGRGVLQPRFGRLAIQYVFGNDYYRGMADDFTIDVYATDGRHVRSIRRASEARPLTDQLVEQLKVHELEQAPPERHESIVRDYAERPRAATLPAYGPAWVRDSRDRLWVQHFSTTIETGNDWSVFDAEGRWLGTIVVPQGFTPHEIGDDSMLGVQRDPLDVETVRRYRLIKP